jgi:hypothetical protein
MTLRSRLFPLLPSLTTGLPAALDSLSLPATRAGEWPAYVKPQVATLPDRFAPASVRIEAR